MAERYINFAPTFSINALVGEGLVALGKSVEQSRAAISTLIKKNAKDILGHYESFESSVSEFRLSTVGVEVMNESTRTLFFYDRYGKSFQVRRTIELSLQGDLYVQFTALSLQLSVHSSSTTQFYVMKFILDRF